jgi:hypothetical protein
MHPRSIALIFALLSACKREPAVSLVTAPPTEERTARAASLDASSLAADASSDSGRRAATDGAVTDGSFASTVYVPYRTRGGVEFYYSREVFEEGPTSPGANASRSFAVPAARSGRAPAARALFAAMSTALSSGATYAMQGAFNALGEGRFVSVVQRTDRGNRRSPVLMVVISSENAGAAQLEGVAEIPTDGVWNESGSNGCPLSIEGRELRDLDGDGELELALVIQFCSQPSCPMGYSEFEYFSVVDLSPSPTVVAMVQRRYRPQSTSVGRRTLRTRWRDTNGDGHNDLSVEGEDCAWIAPNEPLAQRSAAQLGCDTLGAPPGELGDMESDGLWCCVRRNDVAVYDPQRDAWHPARAGATQAEPAPCGPGLLE